MGWPEAAMVMAVSAGLVGLAWAVAWVVVEVIRDRPWIGEDPDE